MEKNITHLTSSFAYQKQATHRNGNRFFLKYLLVIPIFLMALLWADLGWAQPWVYNFGTSTGSYTTAAASTTFLPDPTSGSDRVRVGSQSGSFNMENPGLASLGTTSELRCVAATGTSANKVSVYDYTASKVFYTKFTTLFGSSTGTNTATTGIWYFLQGDGAYYSDNNTFALAQAFTILRWTYGASGAITTAYYNGSAWTNLTTPSPFPLTQATVYNIEIYGNNTTAATTYDRGGTQNLASDKWDLWINGTLVGNDLSSSTIANNVNIDSWGFEGVSSTSNVANIFLDDFEYSNALPTSPVVPILATPTANSIATTGATLGATVTSNGGASLTSRGTVWATTATPTTNLLAEGGTAVSAFSHARSGFTANTLYYYRGYAVNSAGTGYSPDGTFTTIHNAPTVGSGSGATSSSFTASWSAPAAGGSETFTYEIQVNEDNTFTNANEFTQSSIASGTTTANVNTGLSPSTTYYYRVRVNNAGGSSAWSSVSVGYATLAGAAVPTLTTPTATSIATTGATLGATVTSNGGASLTSRGTVWATTATPTTNLLAEGGTTVAAFSHARSGFTANTLYYYRGYAVNSAGTGYSPDGTFTTIHNAPTVGTGSGATSSSFTATWTAPAAAGSESFTYEIQVNEDNTFINANEFTSSGIASGTLTANVNTGLSASTTYYFRVRAVNAGGNSAWSAVSVGYATLAAPSACATDLIISEYIEGSSSNKYIEIYNGTGSSVDLSNYTLNHYNNGSATPTYTIALSGTLIDNDVYVIENSSEALGVSADLSTALSFMTFNGDDAISLYNELTAANVDIIGVIGTDPGTEWGTGLTSTADNTLVRKSTITTGDANGADAFDPSVEWDGYATDVVSNLGSHTMTCVVGTSTVTAGAGTEPATISSLIDTQGEAVLNFDFIVTDDGATPATDALSTKISQIVIGQGTGNDIADWTQAILGALITDGTATQTTNITINASDITIASIANAASGDLGYIADNGTKTYTLKIWLKATMGGTLATTIDGLNLVFRAQNSSFTLNGGSAFASGQDQNSGATNNAVAVVGTKLLFAVQPTTTIVDANMSPAVTVQATDANGNRDLGYSGTVSITSTGSLTSTPQTAALSSGLATFSAINHTASGTGLTLSATLAGLTSATSNAFDITTGPSCPTDLFISEYIEGSDGDNKYIEIYNGTGSSVALNNYQIVLYGNGSATVTTTVDLTDGQSIADGDVWVVSVNTAGDFGSSADQVAGGLTYNGNDAVALRKNGITDIDVIGQIGTDPVTEWGAGLTSTKDNTIRRKSNITSGDDDGTNSFDPATEWDGYADGTVSGLGSHTTATCSSKDEPTNHPTVFTCGTTTSASIPLTWTDAIAGTQAPESYLIKWGTTSFAAITAPSDGTAVADGATAHNVVYGSQAYTPTGLTANTTYYFKIWSYTNSGTSIDYKTDGTIQQTSCITQMGPCLAQGFNGTITDLTTAGWLSSGCLSITSGACEGSGKLGFDLKDDYVVTPAIINPVELTFQYDKSSNTDAWELKVQYNTAQTGTFTTLATISSATTTCQTYTVDLSAYASQTIYIKFLDTRNNGTAQRYIDDVKVYCSTSCSPPTAASTAMTYTSVTNASMVLGWTSGNGSNRIVVAREGSAVNFVPVDGTTYTANADFSAATDLGSGNKIIYKGSSNLVSLTGLNLGTTYYFAVYELNCAYGMEDYLTSSNLTGNQTTLNTPNPVTDLQVSCQTNTSAIISWTAPVGTYENVIIGLRNSTLDCGALSGDGSTFAGNAVFAGAGAYSYGVAPLSYVVYNGTGTTVTVTGLTAGQNYKVMAYTYNGSTWSATQPTTTITSLALSNPTNASLSPQDASMLMTWNTPSCANEVMIVCKTGSAFTSAVPTGNGSAYTADLNFGGSGSAFDGGKVVYKGGTSPQTVTGLTNGTEYCFKFFTRSGTEWSSGYSDCETPLAGVTQFLPGGIAVLGVNSNTYSSPAHCISGTTAGDDEISIVTFQDITAGTTLDMTDNGWEKCSVGKWGNQEGYMRIKRTGATIPAGTIITFRLNQVAAAHFTGVYPDNDWSIEIENGPMIFNSDGDQLYFMQGGTWNQGTLNSNNATYTGGTFLFSFNTNDTWTAGICTPDNNTSGTGRSQNSGLVFGMECFNMVPNVATDYLKYVGDMSTKTQRDWISYIKDGDNWQSYTDCETYYDGTPDYINTTHTIPITTVPVNYLAGVWTGAGGNTDWFYCGNWDNLRVPDKTVNVELPSTGVSNSCNIGAPPSPFTEASCLNITNNLATPYLFSIDNFSSKLDVWGNFSNNFTFSHTAGLVTFKGTVAQTLSANASYVPTFYNLTLNNSAGLTLTTNINITNNISLTSGILNTGTKIIELQGTTSTISETAINPSSYVTGFVKSTRAIGTGTQTFGGIGLSITESSGSNSTIVTRQTGTAIVVGSNSSIKRYFDIEPTVNSSLDATMVFHYFEHEKNGLPEADLELFKSPSPYSTWYSQVGTIDVNANTSTKTGITGFSRWTLADKNNPLPVELLQFEAVCNGELVDLLWSTASETNNDYFTIEKSTDLELWIAVDKVDGAGNSNNLNSYKYNDSNTKSTTIFYRLKQTDYNGATVTFEPVAVKCGEEYQAISVYPNPSTNTTICTVYAGSDFNATLEITNYYGAIVLSKVGDLIKGFNLLEFDVSSFQPGLYYVVLRNNSGEIVGSKQFIVQ